MYSCASEQCKVKLCKSRDVLAPELRAPWSGALASQCPTGQNRLANKRGNLVDTKDTRDARTENFFLLDTLNLQAYVLSRLSHVDISVLNRDANALNLKDAKMRAKSEH